MNTDASDIFVEELNPQLIEKLVETTFCQPSIAAWAELLHDMPIETANQWVTELTDAGEDLALTNLLYVFAYCGFVLDPAVLVRSGLVVSDLSCLSFLFTHQDASVIPHLYKMARSEELSIERQILFCRLAVELTLRYDQNDAEIRRLLQYLSEVSFAPEGKMIIFDTLAMLDAGELEPDVFPILTGRDIKDYLPARPPPKIIGKGGTLRRPVAKKGRNDPCHCGSGKKYKRCCLSKDEKLLADASEYAGITQTQLQANPGIVDDAMLIHGMRAYEIKKLDPSTLGCRQLLAAYRRASRFGLLDIAFNMLVECSERTDFKDTFKYDFDFGHFIDLMERALDYGKLDVAERARALIPEDCDLIDWNDTDMHFELYKNPGVLTALEARCATALRPDDETDMLHNYDLCHLTHIFRDKFPAMSIIFARAAVTQCPERVMDNEMLVEVVHECRVNLGLDPWDDPIGEMVSDGETEYQKKNQALQHNNIELELRGELAAARQQAQSSATKLTDAETRLQKIKKELVATEKTKKDSDEKQVAAPKEASPEQRETMERLRRQIDNLKVEIGNQQEQRRKLRQQLQRQNHSEAIKESASSAERRDDNDEQVEMPSGSERKILIPEYRDSFKSGCNNMPASVVSAALKAIAGIAAYDAPTWRHFSAIKKLTNIYRVRVGIHYRLLLLWLPGERLCALDLIPRQDLETWIKRYNT